MNKMTKELQLMILKRAEEKLAKEIAELKLSAKGGKWITPTPEKRAEYTINGEQYYLMSGGTYTKCSIINNINN
jgi:hypothetical protein